MARIKQIQMRLFKLGIRISFLCFFVLFNLALIAQNYTHQQSVMDYLDRMAQKGNIELPNLVQPLDRTEVFNLLATLQKQNSLTNIEKSELAFYLAQYQFDNLNYNKKLPTYKLREIQKYIPKKIFNNTSNFHPHLFTYTDTGFRIMVDPLLELGITGYSKNSTITSTGIQLMGYVGKRLGFQMSMRDVNETGDFDSTRIENNAPGIIRKAESIYNKLNYSQINATLGYRFNKGSLVVGQDQHVIGYGKMGNIVLSDKAPSYPFFRIEYHPTKWLRFNYMHAWLQSGIVDSTKSYGLGNTVFDGKRQFFVPKFYAVHMVEITPTKGLTIHVGESIVYSDELQLPYLNPISFFKAVDNNKFGDNISAGANGQIFMGISSRNHIPKTHFYTQLFIDEIRISSVVENKKSRNQVAYLLGASVTDVVIPYLTFNAEYSRVNPYVYRNFIPAQNYSHSTYTLGDWMGANADRLTLAAKYNPLPNVSVKGYFMKIGKGAQNTLEQQYFEYPQQAFGTMPLYKQNIVGLETFYEVYNNIQIRFSHVWSATKPSVGKSESQTLTSIGIAITKF